MTKPLSLAFLTKDRVQLSEKTIEPLLRDDIDLWVMDGSKTEAGLEFAQAVGMHECRVRANVTGGADAAIAYALTTLLNETASPYIGLCENDVLLPNGWVGPCLALFQRSRNDGLHVGAVSARAYEDRVFCQRDGYAVMHNLGAGHVVFTREAASLVLKHYRTGWSTENRRIFHQLGGLDIGKYWAFRGNAQAVTGDWTFDRILAAHGLVSLALTPSDVEMLGQEPPLHEVGLAIVRQPVDLLRDDKTFARIQATTRAIRGGLRRLPDPLFMRLDDGASIVFPHQLGALGGVRDGFWRFKWSQGFGPFAYVCDAVEAPFESCVEATVAGPCEFMVSGGAAGAKAHLVDTLSGYEYKGDLLPEGAAGQVQQLVIPGSIGCRTVRLTALAPGVTFYGIVTHEPQIVDPTWAFSHSVLPKP